MSPRTKKMRNLNHIHIPEGSTEFHFIKKMELPGRTKEGIINNLPESKEAVNLLRAVAAKKLDPAPLEAYEVFNLSEIAKRVPEIKSMKTAIQSAATFFRKLLDEHKLHGKMHMVQRKDRIFLVGNE